MFELLKAFLKTTLTSLWAFIVPFLPLAAAAAVVYLIWNSKCYKTGAYYRITGLPYWTVRKDIGRYGEYLTYKCLRRFEKQGARFLMNVYIPKENGETSEIDLMMIAPQGIVVLESKNYSGWIFGDEKRVSWYQTLPSGRNKSHKESFYNPVMQNRSHIRHLEAFLGETLPMKSVIVFSERCTLKNVQITSKDIRVIQRGDVEAVVSALCTQMPAVLDDGRIAALYDRLYPLTQVGSDVKKQHIENIREKQNLCPADERDMTSQEAEKTVIKQEPAAEESTAAMPDVPSAPGPAPEAVKCPKCGGDMILRTASRGANAGRSFYGCSNYPKCRYIQNITESNQ